MSNAYFIGIDVGTQGVRVVLLDETGKQYAAKEEVFSLGGHAREEQSPLLWWECCERLIPALLSAIKNDIRAEKIKAIAVTSTSGTIIPIDHNREPLSPAIMYSDARSAGEAQLCKTIAAGEQQKGFTAFNASCGLPKMRWWLNRYPDDMARLYKFIHAADFITGRLCGNYAVTDYTNALKSGYDVQAYKWPAYITERIGIRPEWLQEVKPSGAPLENIQPALADAWKIPRHTIVTTGMTDGCASQVASGAVSLGQWNTTIGTTLVIKGVTRQEVIDPTGAIYNHRHPSGYWMPGGASNTGADWVSQLFPGDDLQELSILAAQHLPAKHLAWPILQASERFPFVAPQVKGFWPTDDKPEQFTACMEGVAFIERYTYDHIAALSGEKIERIFTAGGGSSNDTWMRIRSAVMNRPVCKMKNVTGAAGAAILAASRIHYASIEEAAKTMVTPEMTIAPETGLVEAYEKKYRQFIQELQQRNILD